MRKISIIAALALAMCLFAFSAVACTLESDMGYSIVADDSEWVTISPETRSIFDERGMGDALKIQGMDDAYFADYENREFEMVVDLSGKYGNINTSMIPEESSEGRTIDDYLKESEEIIVPYYEEAGCDIVMEPTKTEINGRECVCFGISTAGREMYQYVCVNEYNNRWYNMNFTRVPRELIESIVASIEFSA